MKLFKNISFAVALCLSTQTAQAAPFYAENLNISKKLKALGIPTDRTPSYFADAVHRLRTLKHLGPFDHQPAQGILPHRRSIDYDFFYEGRYLQTPLSALIWSFFPARDDFFVQNQLPQDPLSHLTPKRIGAMIGALDHLTQKSISTPLEAETLATQAEEALCRIWNVKKLEEKETADNEILKKLFLLNAIERINKAYDTGFDATFIMRPILPVFIESVRNKDPYERAHAFIDYFQPWLFKGETPTLTKEDFLSLKTFKKPGPNPLKDLLKRQYTRWFIQAAIDTSIHGMEEERHMPQQLLMAFFGKKFSKTQDLKEFYAGYVEESKQGITSAAFQDMDFTEKLPKGWYQHVKSRQLENPDYFWTKLNAAERQDLMRLFMTADQFQPPATSTAKVTDPVVMVKIKDSNSVETEIKKTYTFPDCFETTLRSFLMSLIRTVSDQGEVSYNASFLPKGPARAYFTKYPSHDDLFSKEAQDEWGQVVSFIPSNFKIMYVSEDGYELLPRQINLHNLLTYLFGQSADLALDFTEDNEDLMKDRLEVLIKSIKHPRQKEGYSYDLSMMDADYKLGDATILSVKGEFEKSYANLISLESGNEINGTAALGAIQLKEMHGEYKIREDTNNLSPFVESLLKNAPQERTEEALNLIAQSVKSGDQLKKVEALAGKSLPVSFYQRLPVNESHELATDVAAKLFTPSSSPKEQKLALQLLDPELLLGSFSRVSEKQKANNTFFSEEFVTPEREDFWGKAYEKTFSRNTLYTWSNIRVDVEYDENGMEKPNPNRKAFPPLIRLAHEKGLKKVVDVYFKHQPRLELPNSSALSFPTEEAYQDFVFSQADQFQSLTTLSFNNYCSVSEEVLGKLKTLKRPFFAEVSLSNDSFSKILPHLPENIFHLDLGSQHGLQFEENVLVSSSENGPKPVAEDKLEAIKTFLEKKAHNKISLTLHFEKSDDQSDAWDQKLVEKKSKAYFSNHGVNPDQLDLKIW